MLMIRTLSLAALSLLGAYERASAHTWIDCLDTDRRVVYDNAREWIYGGTKGNGVCGGYINNYPGRGDPDINLKMTFKILMDQVPLGAPICSSDTPDYSGWRHRIQAHPGQKIYYGYLDNGHVAKDKAGRGTFYGVYWTGKADTRLETTNDLTPDRLIDGQLHDFDDGNCGQSYEDGDFAGNVPSGRAGNDYPCVGEIAVPPGTPAGIYNLVWFWKFYNDKVNAFVQTTGGFYGGAAYTSCFQVEVLAGGDVAPVPVPVPGPAPSQPELVVAPSIGHVVAPSIPEEFPSVEPTATPLPSTTPPSSPSPVMDTAPAPVASTAIQPDGSAPTPSHPRKHRRKHKRTRHTTPAPGSCA